MANRFTKPKKDDYRIWTQFVDEETKKRSWKCIFPGIYERNGVRLKVAHTKSQFTVVTFLNHPKWGHTGLVRRNISRMEFIAILDRPRVHTDKGYIPNSPRRRLEKAFEKVEYELNKKDLGT